MSIIASDQSGSYSSAIGINARAYGDNSMAFGDNTIAVHNNEVVVGAKLFGKPLPLCIIESIQSYPQEFKILIRSLIEISSR